MTRIAIISPDPHFEQLPLAMVFDSNDSDAVKSKFTNAVWYGNGTLQNASPEIHISDHRHDFRAVAVNTGIGPTKF